MFIAIGIILAITIAICIWALVEREVLKLQVEESERLINVYRNMYYGLKESKIEESQWKDMTTAEITKVILEEQYKQGRIDVSALLNEGIIRRRENRWGWI